MGCFCPFYQLYLNRQSVDGNPDFSFITCVTSYFCFNFCECFNRKALAAKYNLEYSQIVDCLISFYCTPCAVWQGLIYFLLILKAVIILIFFEDAYEIQQRESPQAVAAEIGTTDV